MLTGVPPSHPYRHRGLRFVCTCDVVIGKVFDWDVGTEALEVNSHFWSNYGYDSAVAMHPPWAGITREIPEVCVHKVASIEIVRVEGDLVDLHQSCQGHGSYLCGGEACRGRPFCVAACQHCPDA